MFLVQVLTRSGRYHVSCHREPKLILAATSPHGATLAAATLANIYGWPRQADKAAPVALLLRPESAAPALIRALSGDHRCLWSLPIRIPHQEVRAACTAQM